MKKARGKKNAGKAKTAASDGQGRGIQFEWPLLAFPVMVLAALGVLYAVNHSLKHNPPTTFTPEQTSPDVPTRNDRTAPPALGTSPDETENRNTALVRALARARQTIDAPEDAPSRSNLAPGHVVPPVKGAAGVIAVLKNAAEQNDQVAIKRCLNELVAMGEDAIEPLLELIAEGDSEAGLWAAEALARMGTPVAASALLDTLAQTEDGEYKEELAKRISGITNHDSWPVLLDTLLETDDATVVRAAGASLSKMADAPILDEIAARFEAGVTESETERLAQLVSSITSPKAAESLLSLAGKASAPIQDSLQRAAVAALGKIGTPESVGYLLRKLESSSPGQGGYIFNTISQITSQQAQASLLYAAAGNKEVSAESGRTAAIYALKNFPDGRTSALLESIIAQEDNTAVATAAIRTLESIRKAAPQATAKADPTVTVPVAPLQK
ncbi:MAG: HEAT repeat domain-containing protein [Sedimentisphaerales bacterium]|nr:HEAT repeat domain-containing protein [Sedimentisphaerales bacterium]